MNTCDGAKLTYGCRQDQNHNTAFLRLPSGVAEAKLVPLFGETRGGQQGREVAGLLFRL